MENTNGVIARKFLRDAGLEVIETSLYEESGSASANLAISTCNGTTYLNFSGFEENPEMTDQSLAALERLQGVMDQFYQEAREALLSLKEEDNE